ncbi:MAG: hypothetical protein ACHQT9_01260 [Candidatus Saccharimonadales bacterium]
MRAINHALTGAAIGFIVTEPALSVPLAFASHFVLDVIPHSGSSRDKNVELKSKMFKYILIIDSILCILFIAILALFHPHNWVIAAICAFVAAMPDFYSFPKYLRARRNKNQKEQGLYGKFASNIQWFERPIGWFVEAAWFIALIIILLPFIKYR